MPAVAEVGPSVMRKEYTWVRKATGYRLRKPESILGIRDGGKALS